MLYRANFISHLGQLQVVNVLHVQTNDSLWDDVSGDTPQAIADELYTQLGTQYRAILATTYTFDRIDVVEVPDPNNPAQVPAAASHLVNLAGTRTVSNSDMPPQLCAVVKLKTTKVGRSFRGHLFMPPLEYSNEVVADVFTVAGGYNTAIQAFCTKLNDSFSGGASWSSLWLTTWNAQIVVYSRTRHLRSQNPVTAEVQSASCDRQAHWLRSRRT